MKRRLIFVMLVTKKEFIKNVIAIQEEIMKLLRFDFRCQYDEKDSIGKRYRRQDEIGTPFCITYDFESNEDHCVTIRERDSMAQIRLPINELTAYIERKLEF